MRPERGYRELRKCRVSLSGYTYFVTTCCVAREALLAKPGVQDMVQQALFGALSRGFERLDGFVLMPDHMHLIFELGVERDLAAVIRDLKTYTALRGNRLLGRQGAFWQEGYFEHALRNEAEWRTKMEYMLGNPVRAGLAETVDEYPWARYGPWVRQG